MESRSQSDHELPKRIDGVRLRPLTTVSDMRGNFTEVFRNGWGLPIQPLQWSAVASKARVLRGMHLHIDHDEYFTLIQGRGCVGLYDFRSDSPTSGQSMLLEIDTDSLSCLCFPRGILHGWYFYEDSLHLQATSKEYADYHPDDNNGCLWSDPELDLRWPDPSPIVSERAGAFPRLANLKRLARDR